MAADARDDDSLHLTFLDVLDDEDRALAGTAETPLDPFRLAYAEARTLLVRTAVKRMAGLYPEAFAVPISQPADAACIETDDLGAAGLTGEQFGALITGAGRAGTGPAAANLRFRVC